MNTEDNAMEYQPWEVAEEGVEYKHHNHEMNLAWQFIASTGVSVFLTGKAGTGKTTFLKRIRELSPKRMVVVAPTGVAAINAGGQTIHSFFQIPFGPFVPSMSSNDQKKFKMSQSKKDMISTLDLLVIDEVSMVRADLLDHIDDTLRRYRDARKPFGGVQLLLIGDLMQLSPVAKPEEWAILSKYYTTPYFFSSRALQSLNYVTIELKHIYRQHDHHFIDLLGHVRTGNIDANTIESLNRRYIPGFTGECNDWVRLTTHNSTANNYNGYRLAQLSTPTHQFKATVKGEFPETSYPIDDVLELKEGAQVMFVKNDPSVAHAYYNGKIGTVSSIDDKCITVTCNQGTENITVEPVTWENTKYTLNESTKEITEEVAGTFTHYPLRLAWAITVHKSQGLTFDHAVLDINASFAHGQVYVALSRCRTLEGLVLTSQLSPLAIKTDSAVNGYIDRQVHNMMQAAARLPEYQYQYSLQLLDELYDFTPVSAALDALTRVVCDHLGQHKPLLYSLMTSQNAVKSSLTEVAQRFRTQYMTMMESRGGSLNDEQICRRIKDSAKYFAERLEQIGEDVLKEAAINIENKQISQIYKRALSVLRESISSKAKIFEALKEEPFTTSRYLNLKAQSLLGTAATKASAPRQKAEPSTKERKNKERKKRKEKTRNENTIDITLRHHREGHTPEQIAELRSLTVNTIYNHLSALIVRGDVKVGEFVSDDHQRQIRQVVGEIKDAYSLSEIKAKLPDTVSFEEIKMVLSDMRKV